ncbi:hypothetical protein BDK61_3663 [Haloarcula quadrata]|uniref:DUF7979 domain-containing protein n=1 Tax=Haloarcula quadrata TaxID=182779 RepID=A0A495QVD3_9EURY|nr:hypothetical protein [Haloarcula quadrata]RKS78026.1 hypothetical protein BDK61_3663 [Haloarcula quadrata]
MPSTNNRQPAGGALVIASLIIVVLGFILVPHPGGAQSTHRIARTVEADEVPESKTVTPVGDLSPEAKSAFREALANEGSYTVHGKENRPPEWYYSDDTGFYYVQSEGTIYEVMTSGSAGHIFDYIKIGPFLLTGIAMGITGIRWLRWG